MSLVFSHSASTSSFDIALLVQRETRMARVAPMKMALILPANMGFSRPVFLTKTDGERPPSNWAAYDNHTVMPQAHPPMTPAIMPEIVKKFT